MNKWEIRMYFYIVLIWLTSIDYSITKELSSIVFSIFFVIMMVISLIFAIKEGNENE